MIRVENVIFFPEKNEFLITRGMRSRYGSFTEKGETVVKIKDFDRYFFDPQNCALYSRRGKRVFDQLKPHKEGAKDYYFLYRFGVKKKVFLWEILRDNLDGIELYFNENKENLKEPKLTLA